MIQQTTFNQEATNENGRRVDDDDCVDAELSSSNQQMQASKKQATATQNPLNSLNRVLASAGFQIDYLSSN